MPWRITTIVTGQAQARAGARGPQHNKPRLGCTLGPAPEWTLAHPESRAGLHFWNSHPREPRLVQGTECTPACGDPGGTCLTCGSGALETHSPAVLYDAPCGLASLRGTAARRDLVLPPGGLRRESVFQLSLGQLSCSPLPSPHLPRHPKKNASLWWECSCWPDCSLLQTT